MVCSSGVSFDPVVSGTHYTFDTAGLYNGLFVMADRQDGSVWTHFDGTVISGPLANTGVRMEILPVVHTTWSAWTEEYPETLVLDWYPEFAARYREVTPGRGGLGSQFQNTLLNEDDRLPENELVVGVNHGDEHRAYVLADFSDGLQIVHDTLASDPIVVFIDVGSTYGLAFEPTLNGQQLEFSVVDDEIRDQIGNIWDLSGKATSGPDSGSQLPFVTSFVTEWYGWVAYHPETSIFNAGS